MPLSDIDFDSQNKEDELVDAFASQVRLLDNSNDNAFLASLNLKQHYMRWRNTRIMNSYIGRILDERFATHNDRDRSKKAIDLALEVWFKENSRTGDDKVTGGSRHLDPEFRKVAIDQVKLFLFAGHDTTSLSLIHI